MSSEELLTSSAISVIVGAWSPQPCCAVHVVVVLAAWAEYRTRTTLCASYHSFLLIPHKALVCTVL